MFARVFDIGKNGIEFPQNNYFVKQLGAQEAAEQIISKLVLLDAPVMMPDTKEKMLEDLRAIYPGITIFY